MPKKTLPRIAEVTADDQSMTLCVRWRGGLETRVDVTSLIQRFRVFEPLRLDRATFGRVRVGEHGTDVVWSEDIDMSAETFSATCPRNRPVCHVARGIQELARTQRPDARCRGGSAWPQSADDSLLRAGYQTCSPRRRPRGPGPGDDLKSVASGTRDHAPWSGVASVRSPLSGLSRRAVAAEKLHHTWGHDPRRIDRSRSAKFPDRINPRLGRPATAGG